MGEIVDTDNIGDDTLLILVAAGLPQWLLRGTKSSSKFFPVPHAVPSLFNDITSRTVFARMKVVPMDAFPTNALTEKKHLFKNFFHGFHQSGSEELCPQMNSGYPLALASSWSELKKKECSQSQAYCWMDCLDLPTTCPQ